MISIESVRVWDSLQKAAALVLDADEQEKPLEALVAAQELAHAADLQLKQMIAVEGLGAAGGGVPSDR